MLVKLRVPCKEQYAFMEFDIEVKSLEEGVALYHEAIETYKQSIEVPAEAEPFETKPKRDTSRYQCEECFCVGTLKRLEDHAAATKHLFKVIEKE
jgi:hypothetical protein